MKQTKVVALLLAALCLTTPTYAWRWNYDRRTTDQVGKNTAAASAVEETHNATLKEQKLIVKLLHRSFQRSSAFTAVGMCIPLREPQLHGV
ncbi:hypothetical protein [uncultured Ruminococcus sp.]|uniref:hypothetical protein n=1 Tax=uncultured Ruminococcus sp. TaxID=165186 RepID=UPI00292FFED2|nr:hypothetical protein [uncultured Ruminococcus sp.]